MSKPLLYVFSFLLLMTALHSAEPNPLERFLWDHRIILVSAPSEEVDAMVSELESRQSAIEERHVLWFIFSGRSLKTNYAKPLGKDFQAAVRKRFFKDDDSGVQTRLIGKDGGVKAKLEKLDLPKLFARIDSMPMRQAEMRKD